MEGPEAAGTAATLLEAGSKAHRSGRLGDAEGFYVQALHTLGIVLPPVDEQLESAGLPVSETAAEALHLLGALRVQRVGRPGGAGADSEDGDDREGGGIGEDVCARGSALAGRRAAEVSAATSLLRGALASLPPTAPLTLRARQLCSLGTALLHLRKGPNMREAVAYFREAVQADPGRWSAYHSLARGLHFLHGMVKQGDEPGSAHDLAEERVEALKALIRLRPDHALAHYKLGMALKELSRNAEAVLMLQRYLELASAAAGAGAPGSGGGDAAKWKVANARHWLAVAQGENTAAAPAEYVARLFDSYADHFDDHLVNKLGYKTPELLAGVVRGALAAQGGADAPCPQQVIVERCADLGCGTGLMGPWLREMGVKHLEGVDLSDGMLCKARERGYDRLICGDLLDIFSPSPCAAGGAQPTGEAGRGGDVSFDLVVAADVFVYVGDLLPVLTATARCLARPHGLVAFSTEVLQHKGAESDCGFKLADTGRYKHSAAYVRSTAEACGLTLKVRRCVVLRHNGGEPVHGHLHLFRHASC